MDRTYAISGFHHMKSSNITIRILLLFLIAGLSAASAPLGWCMDKRGYQNISVEKLKEMLKQKDFVLVNVHIPYAGEISQTDLLIPYHSIESHKNLLPADKNAPIVVYCLSGPMGYIAAEKLVKLGFKKVFHMEAGMMGWTNRGHRLLFRKN